LVSSEVITASLAYAMIKMFCHILKTFITNAKLAVITSEDQLFPDHDGFDSSLLKSDEHNQKSRSLHGASTISQQVAKMFFFAGPQLDTKGYETYFHFYD